MKTILQIQVWKLLIPLQRLLTKSKTSDKPAKQALVQMRQKIDSLDRQIIQLLADRMSVAEAIGQYKKANQMAFHQPNRWSEVKSERLETAVNLGLSEEFTESLLELIHQESLQRQTNDKS